MEIHIRYIPLNNEEVEWDETVGYAVTNTTDCGYDKGWKAFEEAKKQYGDVYYIELYEVDTDGDYEQVLDSFNEKPED